MPDMWMKSMVGTADNPLYFLSGTGDRGEEIVTQPMYLYYHHIESRLKISTICYFDKHRTSELAKMVGIHANVLSRYQRGEARPFVEMAAKLAEAL